MFGDPEYYLRWTGPNSLEIAKFEGTKAPTAVYEAKRNGRGAWRCTCPAANRGLACRHLALIQEKCNEQ